MRNYKKIFRYIMGVAGTLLILLFVLLLMMPKLISLGPVKAKILTYVSEKVNGELAYQKLDLSYWPRPSVIIHRGRLSLPGKVSGTADAIKLYLQMGPLLHGKFQFDSLQVENPEFKMKLPQIPKAKRSEGHKITPPLPVFILNLNAPDFQARVKNGRLDLFGENGKIFSFRDIDARIDFPPTGVNLQLTCGSNLAEKIELKGTLNSENMTTDGHIDLTRFHPNLLADYLMPDSREFIGNTEMNLAVGFQLDGKNKIQAQVEGALPFLTLHRKNKKVVLKGRTLKGSFQKQGAKIWADLTDFSLDAPRLSLSGKFFMDQDATYTGLELEGKALNIPSLRKTALDVAGDVPLVQEIFKIIKGGELPFITFATHGKSIHEWGEMAHITIKGRMKGGHISVPGVELDLKNVGGDISISGGILKGQNLEVQTGPVHGHKGLLSLDLAGADTPFHVDTALETELSRLPAFLSKLINDKSFRKEMTLVDELKGTASGRLAMDGSARSIKTRVELSKIKLAAKYQRLPYPLEIDGGQVLYDGANIIFKNLSARLQGSYASQVSGRIIWQKTPRIEISSAKSGIVLGEIYPWISSVENRPAVFQNLKTLTGSVFVSALDLQGPLRTPLQWRFQMSGMLEDLVVDSKLLPGPITVDNGKFHITPKTVAIIDSQIDVLDASLKVSADLKGYLEGQPKVAASAKGIIGIEAIQWISSVAHLPRMLELGPLSVEQTRLSWNSSGKTSFAGRLTPSRGPAIEVDVRLSPEALVIRKLRLQDDTSRATFTLHKRKNRLDLTFAGHLAEKTISRFLPKYHESNGWFKGDFQARIDMDQLSKSTVSGRLQGYDLDIPWQRKIPLKIQNAALNTHRNRLEVESAQIQIGDIALGLSGEIKATLKALHFDLDVDSDELVWADIEKIISPDAQRKKGASSQKYWDVPVSGVLRLKAGAFNYKKYTWKHFRADIDITPKGVDVKVKEGSLCGISTPGALKVSPEGLALKFNPSAQHQELAVTIPCLSEKHVRMEGNFSLKGEIAAQGQGKMLTETLQGNLEFNAENGRIHRLNILSKLFAILNFTEIFAGKMPDLEMEGFGYNSIKAKITIQNGQLILKELLIDGIPMEIASHGDINLLDRKLNLTVLVAPLRTVDRVVKNVPFVKRVLGGRLISIPVKIRGTLENPVIIPLSPTAVGSELLGIMKRTLQIPFKMIQPLLSGNIPDDPEPGR